MNVMDNREDDKDLNQKVWEKTHNWTLGVCQISYLESYVIISKKNIEFLLLIVLYLVEDQSESEFDNH